MIEHVKEYYNENAEFEWNRFDNPYRRVEFETTKHLLRKYLPPSGHILDIGSGPGRYSIELLKDGYQVSLLDISLRELDIAKREIERLAYEAEGYYCQSATELDEFEDGQFDAILIMGPMYHLSNASDRNKVLREAHRIVKDDGIVFISYINNYGLLRAGLSEFPDSFRELTDFDNYRRDEYSIDENQGFTAVYFSTPDFAMNEVTDARFSIITRAGAESFLSGLNIQLRNLEENDKSTYDNFLRKACELCEMPEYRDATEHLNIVAKKGC
jgi:SAM-dependent methyltransferase